MITDLPQGFQDTLKSRSRKPVQLAHIHVGDTTCYYSDNPIGKVDGLMHDYEPRVESWGALKDTSDIDISFRGNSLEVRSTTLTLILTGDAMGIFVDLLGEGIENSTVEIYQWFLDTPTDPPQLMDIFIAQDPISFSERSSLFTMDLVSTIMKNDPYLWDRRPGTEVRDIVVGKVPNIPLHDMQTAKKSTLTTAMTFDGLGTFYIANGVGFRKGPDEMVIDSEVVGYDWISASGINITHRGLNGTKPRPHESGAAIFHPDAVFDYSISAGPVIAIEDLLTQGEPYTNQVTFITGQDPTIARFIGRPPWLKVSVTDGPIIGEEQGVVTLFASDSEAKSGEGAVLPLTPENINNNDLDQYCYMYNVDTPYVTREIVTIDPQTFVMTGATQTTTDYTLIRGTHVNADGYFRGGSNPTLGTLITSPSVSAEFQCGIDKNWQEEFPAGTEVRRWKPYFRIPTTSLRVLGVSGSFSIDARVDYDGWPRISAQCQFDLYDYTELDPPWYPHENWSPPLDYDAATTDGVFSDSWEYWPLEHTLQERWDSLPNFTLNAYVFFNKCRTAGEEGWTTTFPDAYFPFLQAWWEIEVEYPLEITSPWQDVCSIFRGSSEINGTLTYASAFLKFAVYIWGADYTIDIVGRFTDNPEDNIVIATIDATWNGHLDFEETVLLPVNSMSELEGFRVGLHAAPYTASQDVERTLDIQFEYIEWTIGYTIGAIPTPDEERVVYAEDLTCTVTGILGPNPTPPQVIEYMLVNHSPNSIYVDNDWFNRRHLEYLAEGYYFNGVLDGDIRLHDALKQCLFEGMCRFLFDAGAIRLITYEGYNNEEIDYTIENSTVALRSKEVNNQPTSTIRNNVKIYYLWNAADGVYDEDSRATDDDSIFKYESHELRLEMKLIRDDRIASIIANYNLDRRSRPLSVYSMDMFLEAYVLQKGDKVKFKTIYDGRTATGFIAATTRTFGKGKSNQINKIELQISEPRVTGVIIDLEDIIDISDDNLFTAGAEIHIRLTDTIKINEDNVTVVPALPDAGFGGQGYGTGGYGE